MGHYSSMDRSPFLHIRDCYSLWYGIPTDFCSERGYSPPHLPMHYCTGIQLDLPDVHSLLLAGSRLISFPPPTKMLQFSGLLHITVHRQTSGSKTACVYPERFAACRVAVRALAKPSTKWFLVSANLLIIAKMSLNNPETLNTLLCYFQINLANLLSSLHTHQISLKNRESMTQQARCSRAMKTSNKFHRAFEGAQKQIRVDH